MSEFTAGILYPRTYEPKVLRVLQKSRQPFFHKNVNEQWNAFFLQDEWLQKAQTVSFLLKLAAKKVPLLWFHDTEERGWGFRLFDGGYEVSSVTIPYELDVEMAEAELARRYPDTLLTEDIAEQAQWREKYEAILKEVTSSERYRLELAKGIRRFHPQAFLRLVGTRQVQQLQSLFDLGLLTDYDDESGGSILYDSVDLFKEILGMEEMIWVNYSYLASGGRE